MTSTHEAELWARALAMAIRAERAAMGLSAKLFAMQAGISSTVYGGIERGTREVKVEQLRKIAAVIGVSPGRMLELADVRVADLVNRNLLLAGVSGAATRSDAVRIDKR